MTTTKAQELLDKASLLQAELWDTLSALESEIGIDVDSNRDLAGLTVEDLAEESDS